MLVTHAFGRPQVVAIRVLVVLALGLGPPASRQAEGRGPAKPARKASKLKGTPLFDGKTLAGWKPTRFGGEGEVTVEDGKLLLEFGFSLTGVTYQREFPKMNYEVSLEAMRVDGIDFFCALTFPVDESHCSLIVGGWAGSVVGLSSIDGRDASENETTRYMSFKNGRWYRIRVRVTKHKIEAWIDDEKVVDQDIKGRRLDTRVEVDLSKPFGVCAWETRAAIRNIRLRRLGAGGTKGPKAGKSTK
jgi:hypothetical protein